uniref:Uncharacterized protein n=1 Tax=Glossina palpalis gambiensis TaxID=67801 RepID=A0A1B0BDV4_9MUSC
MLLSFEVGLTNLDSTNSDLITVYLLQLFTPLPPKFIYESHLEMYMLNRTTIVIISNSTDNFVAHRYVLRYLSICAFHRDDEYIDIVNLFKSLRQFIGSLVACKIQFLTCNFPYSLLPNTMVLLVDPLE